MGPPYEDPNWEDTEAAAELSPEQQQAINELLSEPDFEDIAIAGIQELFERVITLENVLLDVITILGENANQPNVAAEKLRGLLVPTDPQEV